jgi:hypothetical protein
MSNFINNIIKNSVNQIKYRETVVNGEVTSANSDGTYDVKIAQASSAYPSIESILYGEEFSVGEIVDVIFEYGCKEAPKIIGHSKKIAQEPLEVEVDYSGTSGATYTITYNGNGNTGGTAPIDANLYEEGELVTVLNKGSLTKTGLFYIFLCWNTVFNGSGTNYYPGDTFNMGTANIILYAIWVAPW